MKSKIIQQLMGLILILSMIFVSLFVWISPGSAAGNTYYVSPTGNDSNPGTQAQPWKTIQKAANTVTAGDTVYVQSGTYDERVSISASGTSSVPILFQGQGTVTLNGFVFTGNYIQIKGFTIQVITCSAAKGKNYGIEVDGTGSNFLIENNRIIMMPLGGIYTSPQTSNGMIQNNYFENNVENSIELHGQNHLIQGNEINGAIQKNSSCGPKGDDANGIWLFGTGHVVRGNYIHDIHYTANVTDAHMDCFQTFGGWESGDPARNTNILIEQNYCEALGWRTADETGSGFTVEDTSSTDNTYAHGIIFRNNLVFAAQCAGVQENTAWFSYVNNTCATTSAIGNKANLFAMDLWPGTAYDNHHYVIENNIYYNFLQPVYLNSQMMNTGTVIHGNNLAYNGGSAMINDTGFTCGQNSDICADPLFNYVPSGLVGGDYTLQANSPAIDSGAALPDVTTDYAGNFRPVNGQWDMGAYEYQTSSPTNTPIPPTAIYTTAPSTPTATPIPPTATNTAVPSTPTATLIQPTATNTPVPPTATSITPTAISQPSQQQIFFDGFESAFPGSWYKEGSTTWYTGVPKIGSHSVRMAGNNCWMQRSISTVGYHNIVLRVYLGASSYEASETLNLYWYNGSSFQLLKAIRNGSPEEDGQLHYLEFVLPAAANNLATFKVGFGQYSADTTDYGYIDSITVLGTP